MTLEQEAKVLHDDEAHLWPALKGILHGKWSDCNDEHRQRYRNFVERLRRERGES